LWQFNDMWPAISWAVLDYTGFRKLAWHAMKAAYRPRTVTIGRVDQGAALTIINDTSDKWSSKAQVTLIDQSGGIVSVKEIAFSIEPYGVSRTSLVEEFPQIASLHFEGFILADVGEARAARRTTLDSAKAAPQQSLQITTQRGAKSLSVSVEAKSYVHELSLLSEVAGLGTNSDSQLVSLLPGEKHTFTVSGDPETLKKIQSDPEQYLWSHNRIVNAS